MNWFIIGLASFLSGLLGSLGMGGGSVLLLYLRMVEKIDQLPAQGINLVFFIPIGLLSILLHWKNKLVEWKCVLLCVLSGIPAVFLGVWLSNLAGNSLLSKLFAGLLFLVGVRELMQK
ncbi:sulfite exporter TauE/SafE family protein [Youxingia wuxianensis]|uniref:Probable membrane transporter protein n=1 Tax=Youxingia wuxianensis TaxID=2763678 RepID=A0A926ENU9_9FIRM|nr:sulfite exporter TauE/SafE family protein [Youxingia wuxianensis]MBC8585785.1 sulfite exporter TauE/SafE family protein [Youxingia wuxianensis]